MNCEIISVGTEILLGDILNTNAQYLSKKLAELGVNVLHQCTVGDNEQRLSESIKNALQRSDAVILTGGLGPTSDDITKEVCAEVLGLSLELDEGILLTIKSFFEEKNIEMPQSNEKQAYVIKGSTVLYNKNGTAPGLIAEKDGRAVIILPGPPKEMVPMFEEYVRPYFESKTHEVIISRMIRTFGIGESAMAEKVSDLLCSKNPTVAPYAKDGEALLRVTAKAETTQKAEEMLQVVVEDINSRLGDYIYGIDVENIETAVVELLQKHKLKVSFAESCTGGLCAKRITDISGSSNVFECGFVTYSNEIKQNILGVNKHLIDEYTAVCEDVAIEMAKGTKEKSLADYAASVTGWAGPGDEELVGTIYICVYGNKKIRVKKLVTGHRGNNCRAYNRIVAASWVFNLLRLAIKEDFED